LGYHDHVTTRPKVIRRPNFSSHLGNSRIPSVHKYRASDFICPA
jgi:hypothetical protein